MKKRILCLLLGLLCAWLLSRYLSKPVNELDEAMKRVEKGDYAAELSSDREDEMGRLTASFNRMTREYRQNLERSVQRERELNETELSMMQAQLNPHFLYNTLDSIKWPDLPCCCARASPAAGSSRSSASWSFWKNIWTFSLSGSRIASRGRSTLTRGSSTA